MNSRVRQSVRELDAYVPGEQWREPGVIKLNTNENPYPASPEVTAALRDVSAVALARYPDPMATRLREQLARLHGCDISNIFVGNGSDEILALCTRAFVEDDGAVAYFEPSYSLYPVLADMRNVGREPVELATDFGWPAADMAPGSRGASLFFLAYPNAPTGMLYERETVREFCDAFAGVVVIDEAYVDFAGQHCDDMALEFENVLAVRTFSKSYSLAGMRIGYALGSSELVEALFKLKDSYNTNVLSQAAALAAVKDREHMLRNVGVIRTTRARLAGALRDRGFVVLPSEANFLMARPPSITAEELYKRLRAVRILVRYFPGRRTADHVRITVGADEQIDALLKAIDETLRPRVSVCGSGQ